MGMVSGFNTNIRHRGVLFHVQSEASGVSNPHILTHLFKGGDILASMKGEYADMLGADDLDQQVRSMMENQHKTMLRGLTRGEHDEAIVSRLGPNIFDDEKGPDTDVTIPPPEIVEPSPVATKASEETPAGAAPSNGTEPESAKEQLTRAFGDGVVSQKPLDEVVLDFLVDNARKRKRPPK
ncbi:MAG: hypothetical protein IH973_05645 [Myxococcales bacterium]|nr:hypothetical protein [Myxococcales bacterium]